MANLNVSRDEIKNKADETVRILKQDVSDDVVQMNLENCPIKNEFVRKYLVVIPAVLSIAALFFTFITFSSSNDYADSSVSCSGFDALFGDYSTFAGWIVLLCPALVIASNFISKVKPFRRAISVCGPALSLIFEIVAFFAMKSNYMKAAGGISDAVNSFVDVGMEVSCSAGLGFFIMIISYILTAAAGLIAYFGVSFNKKQ